MKGREGGAGWRGGWGERGYWEGGREGRKGRDGGEGREGGREEGEGWRERGREGGREPEASDASGIVWDHLGVTSLNVELRNYVISRQIAIERRVT